MDSLEETTLVSPRTQNRRFASLKKERFEIMPLISHNPCYDITMI